MKNLLGIWSEVHQDYVCWARSPEEALRLWASRGYQQPYEKMVLVASQGGEVENTGETIKISGYSKETILQVLLELEMLEQEGLCGFEVTRFL